jgi:hypothetical protein
MKNETFQIGGKVTSDYWTNAIGTIVKIWDTGALVNWCSTNSGYTVYFKNIEKKDELKPHGNQM